MYPSINQTCLPCHVLGETCLPSETSLNNRLSWSIAFCLCLAAQPVLAQRFASFGDNIADPGSIPGIIRAFNSANGTQIDPNFPPAPPAFGNRFSNGLTAAELLPGQLNFGFNDVQHRAVGNAFSGQLPVSLAGGILLGNGSSIPGPIGRGLIALNQTDIASQVSQYLRTTGRLGAFDLILLYASGNDAALALNTIALTMPPQDQALQIVASGAQVNARNTAASAASLLAAGAGTVLVSNLPNIGQTPAALAGGLSGRELATLFSVSTNRELVSALSALSTSGQTLLIADTFTLTNDIVANPGKYGFTDVSTPCSLLPSCVSATREIQDRFLFWDPFFPTARGHQISAAFLADTVNAPRTLAALSEQGRHANERFVRRQLGFHSEDSWVSTSIDVAEVRRDSAPFVAGYKSSGESVDLQFGWKSDSELTLGATLGLGQADVDYRSFSASFEHNRQTLGVFASWVYESRRSGGTADESRRSGDTADESWQLSASAAYSNDEFDRFVRDTGVAGQQSRADSEGDSQAAMIEARWRQAISKGSTWSPFLRLGYAKSAVDGFTESGATGLSQQVEALALDGSFAELGATFSAEVGPFTGSLTGFYHQQISDSRQRIRSALVSLSTFTRESSVDAPNQDYGQLDLWIEYPIGAHWRLDINASTVFGGNDLSEQGGSVVLRYAF
jgi:outer membrane lipase/esterase